jgi:hypothetical protein
MQCIWQIEFKFHRLIMRVLSCSWPWARLVYQFYTLQRLYPVSPGHKNRNRRPKPRKTETKTKNPETRSPNTFFGYVMWNPDQISDLFGYQIAVPDSPEYPKYLRGHWVPDSLSYQFSRTRSRSRSQPNSDSLGSRRLALMSLACPQATAVQPSPAAPRSSLLKSQPVNPS